MKFFKNEVNCNISGGVPEWTKGADSKSARGDISPLAGSNPASSAIL